MQNDNLIVKIIENIGGLENIISVTNCMTRLRIKLIDNTKVQIEALQSLEGVMGVIDDEVIQIVVGPGKAKKLSDLIAEKYNIPKDAVIDWQANKQVVKSSIKDSLVKKCLRIIANIFVPLIPAIIAAGLFNGLASLLGQMAKSGLISAEPNSIWTLIRLLFSLFGSGFLGYFAIYTGINSAKQFGATEAFGGMIGAMSLAPGIIEISKYFSWYDEKNVLNSILTTGKGGLIGVIVGVYILSKIERAIRKRMPEVLDLVVTPLLTLTITGFIFAIIVMPLAGFASDYLVAGLSVIINSSNSFVRIVSGFILAALFLPMVLLGLHHGLIPIYAVQLQQLGGVTLFPVLAMAGAGQVGAALAIYIKAKKVGNKQLKEVIIGALPAGFLGVGEPLIYGVTLPLGKPFITAGLGAGFGGAFVMLMGVMSSAWGPSGLVALPLMTAGVNGATGLIYYLLGLFIAYIAGFIITYISITESDVESI